MSKTIEIIKKYIPFNEQETIDKNFFIESEEKLGEILTRNNHFCHLSSSALVLNKDRTKVLCIYHKIYDSWTIPGGHADGDDDMIYVAKKELAEETSLKNFKLVQTEPFSIEAIGVQSHFKKEKFINSHVHLNLTYLFEADENDFVHIQEDENSNISWLSFDELISKSTEPHMIKIYKKCREKLNK